MLFRIQQRGKHKGRVPGEAVENESLQKPREEKALVRVRSCLSWEFTLQGVCSQGHALHKYSSKCEL